MEIKKIKLKGKVKCMKRFTQAIAGLLVASLLISIPASAVEAASFGTRVMNWFRRNQNQEQINEGEFSFQDITIYLWGDKPNQMDEVLAEFNATGGQELNMSLNLNFSSMDDYWGLRSLRLAAGEPLDACFDAQWMTMMDFIAEGSYRDLSPFFHNPEYPGLMAAFNEEYMNNNRLGTDGAYGIPFSMGFGADVPLVFIRGDLREKYGLPEITTPGLYRQFLQAVVENEPRMVPYAASPNTYNTSKIYSNENDLNSYAMWMAGVWDYIPVIPNLIDAYVHIEDGKLMNAALVLEPNSAFADFPAPYNDKRFMPGMWGNSVMARYFFEQGWLDQDFLSVTDPRGQFSAGAAASIYWDEANYAAVVANLMDAVPEAKIEIYQPSTIFRNSLKGMIPGSYEAWNFLCIPITTPDEKAARIMMFYDWMYSDPANHALFELGIEGKHWVPVGENQYRMPDGIDPASNYNLPGYQLTWNPNFIKISADFPKELVGYVEHRNNPEAYFDRPYTGFTFQPANVATAAANPDIATLNAARVNIDYGMVPNVIEAYTKLEADMLNNKNLMEDLATIKAEFVKQFDAFLKSIE
jgi:putative aldouronate transport system substrate-binding protein